MYDHTFSIYSRTAQRITTYEFFNENLDSEKK